MLKYDLNLSAVYVMIDDFELSISNNTVLSVQSRNIKLENIERSEGSSISLNIVLEWIDLTLNSPLSETLN